MRSWSEPWGCPCNLQGGGYPTPTAMAIIIPMLQSKWTLDPRSIKDLRSLASLGLAGYMHANGIAAKLVKKAAMGEPLVNASTFVTQSVINAKKTIKETGA